MLVLATSLTALAVPAAAAASSSAPAALSSAPAASSSSSAALSFSSPASASGRGAAQPASSPAVRGSIQPVTRVAALDPEPLSVKLTDVVLGGDPRRPSAVTKVTVTNDSTQAERAGFTLSLVSNLTIGSSTDCAPTGDTGHKWTCGGWDLAPGKSVTVGVPIVAAQPEAVFGIKIYAGTVQGITPDGRTGLPQDFAATYPAKTTLKLNVVRDPLDPQSVQVKATNAGTIPLDAYSLIVLTPTGVKVTSTACKPSDDGQWCEVYRNTGLAQGATDTFQLHLSAPNGPRDVKFYLAPTARYTNADTTALVSVG
ncbi:hypothetical protein Ahu01nite_057290 [Winogradskya humida]|uniref:Repeat protein (TIGR01451 family) n=1 Tax=Winogradskya humida TaxID=113566 RepID=A0ABQ3ZWQ8_9ACTN|nr:hypothetical protein Ahu01nite_057290 [Actinoplanes humidus]